MTNPIEELKEKLEKVWEEDDGIPGGEHCTCVDLKEIAEDFKRLAECYREIASQCGHTCHSSACKPTCEMFPSIDQEASELFQGRTK